MTRVLPVFDALGQATTHARISTAMRGALQNPFLDHRHADIARNHEQKKQRRFQPVIDLAHELRLRIEAAASSRRSPASPDHLNT